MSNLNLNQRLIKAAYLHWASYRLNNGPAVSPYICDCLDDIHYAIRDDGPNCTRLAFFHAQPLVWPVAIFFHEEPEVGPAINRFKEEITAMIEGSFDVQTYLSLPLDLTVAKPYMAQARLPEAMAFREELWKRLAQRYEVEL